MFIFYQLSDWSSGLKISSAPKVFLTNFTFLTFFYSALCFLARILVANFYPEFSTLQLCVLTQ